MAAWTCLTKGTKRRTRWNVPRDQVETQVASTEADGDIRKDALLGCFFKDRSTVSKRRAEGRKCKSVGYVVSRCEEFVAGLGQWQRRDGRPDPKRKKISTVQRQLRRGLSGPEADKDGGVCWIKTSYQIEPRREEDRLKQAS